MSQDTPAVVIVWGQVVSGMSTPIAFCWFTRGNRVDLRRRVVIVNLIPVATARLEGAGVDVSADGYAIGKMLDLSGLIEPWCITANNRERWSPARPVDDGSVGLGITNHNKIADFWRVGYGYLIS